jgi:hypothetical protein
VSSEEFSVEEETVVPVNLGEPNGAGGIPVEIGAEAVENDIVDVGGDLVQSTHGENTPQQDGELSHSEGSVGVTDPVSAHGSGLMQDMPKGSGGQGDYSSDEEPERFRDLNDIYDHTDVVELQYDSDGDALLAELDEPNTYGEAAGNPEWEEAMDKEIQSIEKYRTWELSKLPAGHKAIGLK